MDVYRSRYRRSVAVRLGLAVRLEPAPLRKRLALQGLPSPASAIFKPDSVYPQKLLAWVEGSGV
jgi:hypothetical protein